MAFFISLLIGGIAGWIAATFMKNAGYGLLPDIAIGVIGGLIGGWVFAVIGITGGSFIVLLITAIIGAVVLLAASQAAKRAGLFAT